MRPGIEYDLIQGSLRCTIVGNTADDRAFYKPFILIVLQAIIAGALH